MAFYSVKNVYKNFGSNRVLKGIDFELEEGQVLAIIGSSGSGKTTLLRCINFLEIPDKAEIYLNDENIFSIDNIESVAERKVESEDTTSDIAPLSNSEENSIGMVDVKSKKKKREKKEKINTVKLSKEKQKQIAEQRLKFGMVFQSFNLFPHFNVFKNVTLAAYLKCQKTVAKDLMKKTYEDIEKRAKEILKRVGLGDKLRAYPCELSGGQQQRVAIARALILQPEILCFDEPTSALDPELTREVLKVIKDLKKDGHTMIVVTHEMEFARKVADKVIFMANGIIEEQGSPEEVFGNPKSEKTKAFLQESEKVIDEV
ncbi:MAG: amino acid ABC transporter ATP-binding protein [Clostridia bacterium]|nr:amino acid ABC transporter ATP-binding protein [Clostridia bacterium]